MLPGSMAGCGSKLGGSGGSGGVVGPCAGEAGSHVVALTLRTRDTGRSGGDSGGSSEASCPAPATAAGVKLGLRMTRCVISGDSGGEDGGHGLPLAASAPGTADQCGTACDMNGALGWAADEGGGGDCDGGKMVDTS